MTGLCQRRPNVLRNDNAKAYAAKKNVQGCVFADGTAEKSIERKFAEDMDLDDKVVVYTKLPLGFQISTPVSNYALDWAIAFKKETVRHIYFIAETKESMENMDLRPIEQAKIKCAKKLFNEILTDDVVYDHIRICWPLWRVYNHYCRKWRKFLWII